MPKLSFSIGFLWPKVLEKFGAADGYIRTNTVVTVSKNRLQSLDNNQLSTKYRYLLSYKNKVMVSKSIKFL